MAPKQRRWGGVVLLRRGDPAAEAWIRERALAVLEGGAREVAAGIRRRATTARLPKPKRKKADQCAKYLVKKAAYLDYPTALAAGWPIATGVIEGTCRYSVADRMDITGARWSVDGAEAVLKLRALRCNGDFDSYYRWHLDQEQQRVHASRYAEGVAPLAAWTTPAEPHPKDMARLSTLWSAARPCQRSQHQAPWPSPCTKRSAISSPPEPARPLTSPMSGPVVLSTK